MFDTKAIADGTKRNVSATITELRLEKPIGTTATELNKNSSFYVAMDWKVDNPNEILNEGDYFDIDLPDNLRFPPGYAQEDFPLTDSNNNIIASAHLTRGPETVGGKIRVTFNNNIKNKYNVHGTLYLGALFNKTVTVDNQQNTFSVVVNGKQASTTVKVTKITKPADQVLTKWGARTTENGQTKNEVSWYVDVNYRQANLKNAVITDSLTGQGEYIPSSFKLQKVVYNDEGQITSYGDIVDLTTILTFDNGNKSFKIDLGNGGTSQYRLFYKTTYVAGTELKNKISISYVGETKEVSYNFKDQKAGGTAGGDLASKIKLIKVDEEDQNVVLQDAVFEVTGPDNQKFELRTGADGTIVSNVLRQGTYKVREIIAPQGYVLGEEEYTLKVTPAGGAIQKITNKKNKINISGTKTWNDNDDQDGKRPTEITVILKKTVDGQTSEVKRQDVTPNSEGEWKYEFTNLPLYEDGKPITYSVDEVDVPGYTKETIATKTTNGPDYNLTNKHKPEKRTIEGQKIWKDNNNQDGKRPTSIKVKLYKKVGNNNPEYVTEKVVTEGADKAWKWKFENLDKYENKQEIQYTVEEEVTNGYAGVVTGSMAAGFKITNSYKPETVNISGEKTWDDNNNQDGKRPESITVKLVKQVEGGQPEVKETKVVREGTDKKWKYEFNNLPRYENGKLITYSIDEEKVAGYDKVTTRTTNGPDYNLTNKHEPEKTSVKVTKAWNDANNQDGVRPDSVKVKLLADGVETDKTVTLTKENNWKGSFDNLDKYKTGKVGQEIQYTVKEEAVENGYVGVVTGSMAAGFNITNTRTPGKTKVEVTKVWEDKDNQDGVRPASVKVKLLADGVEVPGKTLTLTATNNWKGSFADLDEYKAGKKIVYTVKEEEVGNGYDSKVIGSPEDGFKVINTRQTEKVNVEGTKTWNDADNQDGKRPTEIKINLLKNGTVVETKTVTEKDGWKWKFENLDKYANGEVINYTITEEAVENGYTSEITKTGENTFTVKNTREPEKTFVEGTKTWDDANNQDGKRPTKIKVTLYKKPIVLPRGEDDGRIKVAEKEVTQADDWKWKFENLDKYEAGQQIEYFVTEDPVEGYTTEINKVGKEDGRVEFNIVNKHLPEKAVVSGTKTWVDNNDQAGKRPGSIKVILNKTVDGKTSKVAEKEVTAKDNWNYAFDNLPKYENGKLIEYSIDEVDVPGYKKSIKGYNLENKYIPKKPGLPNTGSTPTELGGLGLLAALTGLVLARRKNKAN